MARRVKGTTGGGGKLERTETVTIRLDPQLRYLAGLAARKQRRTLSSYIEWAVAESLKKVSLKEVDGMAGDYTDSLANEIGEMWDTDEADRFAKLAFAHPDMLSHEEQILWKLIRENGLLWRGHFDRNEPFEWTWKAAPQNLISDHLRNYWEVFKSVAKGEISKDELPRWVSSKKPDGTTSSVSYVAPDDDIPF
ncbi:MAG: hypothetical protein ACP5SH_26295 [Syntrophobacteraceae bacterium]